MAKFDPKLLNGTHQVRRNDGEIDKVAAQWYPGVGAYYVIINNDPALQFALSLRDFKRLLKDCEVKAAA